MSKKERVVFENKDFQVIVVPGIEIPHHLCITRKGGRSSVPVTAKIIAEDDGLAIFAEQGDMSVVASRIHQGVIIKPVE